MHWDCSVCLTVYFPTHIGLYFCDYIAHLNKAYDKQILFFQLLVQVAQSNATVNRAWP